MTVAAKVVVYEAGAANPFPADAFRRHGYSDITIHDLSEAPLDVDGGHPDIVIVNAGRQAPADLERRLGGPDREGGSPLILITDEQIADTDSSPREYGIGGAFTQVLSTPLYESQLFSRVGSLVRLNAMRAEMRRRAQSAEEFGVALPSAVAVPQSMDRARVLVAGTPGTDFEAVRAELADFSISFAPNVHSVPDLLIDSGYDALVLTVDEDPSPLETLADLRRNSRLYHFPVIVIADPAGLNESLESQLHAADDVLMRPLGGRDLRARLRALVLQHRYRREMTGAYADTRHPSISDSLTGFYSFGFLHAHLARQIADAERAAKPLTICLFDIKDLKSINQLHGYAAGDVLVRQVAGVIGRLVRGEDLAARYGGDRFCVVLPDTDAEFGETVLQRILSVIGNTEFAVRDGAAAVHLVMKSSLAERHRGETAEALIKRAADDANIRLVFADGRVIVIDEKLS